MPGFFLLLCERMTMKQAKSKILLEPVAENTSDLREIWRQLLRLVARGVARRLKANCRERQEVDGEAKPDRHHAETT
jgi:hypothetical protein